MTLFLVITRFICIFAHLKYYKRKNQVMNSTGRKQSYPLSEYLQSSHVSMELLDLVKSVFLRHNRFSSVLISVDDESVIGLAPSVLSEGAEIEPDFVIEVQPYAIWREDTAASFTSDYDLKRFNRSTVLETLRRKVSDHKRYSFVAHQQEEGIEGESVIKYEFIRLSKDAKFILATQLVITSTLEHDVLTGGLNRAGLLRELEGKFQLIGGEEQYSILYFNIQNFRMINELHGAKVGDRVLQQMYTSLVYSSLHPVSYARLDSDNFVCMIDRKNFNADVVKDLCHQDCVMENLRVPFRCLCGIYHLDDPEISPINACDHAKLAISYIKDRLLQPWMVFNSFMQKSYSSDAEILKELDDAINNDEFVPFYQPIVDTQTGSIVMAEALVRWKSPAKGLVPPGVFIPVLERHGGLSRIDMLMEKKVFDMQCQRYQDKLPVVPVDLNLSWVDFSDTALLDQLYQHVKDPALPVDYMRYEITESALAEIAENRYDVLDFFKVQRVKLLIDDFGQGYSFGTMKDVDFHIIKIDKSLIDQIGTSRKVNLLIETIINMFHKMHAKVVAEGVETEMQVNYLRKVGCDYIQGYFFYKPMDQDAFLNLLENMEEANEAARKKSGVKSVKADAAADQSKVSKFHMSYIAQKFSWLYGSIQLKDFKSTFLIVAVCAFVAAAIYFTTYNMVNNLVTENCDEMTERDIDKIKLNIDMELGLAQEVIQTFAATVFSNGLDIPRDEKEIYEMMENFLAQTPNISGIVAGFEDSVFPQYADKRGFGPLVRNQNNTLVRYQVGEIRDFRKTKEWYFTPLATRKAGWSSPFFSEEGDIIISYSVPLFDKDRKVIGVVACDLSISQLQSVIEQIKPYPSSMVMIMQEDLTFVIHPEKGYAMHRTLPIFLRERGVPVEQTIIDALSRGETGKAVIDEGHNPTFLYYDVIDRAGYRLLIESPSEDVYKTLTDISSTLKGIGFGGLSALILTLAIMLYDNKKRERRSTERSMRILRHSAETDGLTDIFNRAAGEKMISELMAKNTPGVFAILDCDKFKQVNDNYGHASGDKLLKHLAEALKTSFPTDITLHLGGDEFAVFCSDVRTAEDFQERAQLFFAQVRDIRIEEMGNYEPSVSMGAAVYHGEDGLPFDRLYTMADKLLYESKKTEGCALTISDN